MTIVFFCIFLHFLHFLICIFIRILHFSAHNWHICADFKNAYLCIFCFAYFCILVAYYCIWTFAYFVVHTLVYSAYLRIIICILCILLAYITYIIILI